MNKSKTNRLLQAGPTLVLASMLLGSVAAALTTHAAQRIRLGTLAPKGSSYYNEINKMGREWKNATKGKVSLTIYPDGRMGGEAQMVRRMRVGQLQAGFFSAVGLTEIEPAVSGLQNVPLMFDSLEEVDHIGTQLKPLLEQQLQKKGFKVLFWVNAGWVHFFTKSPISTPDDLRNLKVFTWAGSPEVVNIYKGAGFTPVPLETKDILPQLQTGLISAVPMPPMIANATRVDTRAPYMLDLNWAPLVGAAVVTTKTWNRLQPATQAAVLRIATETGSVIQKIGREEAVKSIDAMKKRGLKVQSISDQARAEWDAAVKEVYPQIRGTVVPADIFDKVTSWVSEFREK